MPRSAGKNVENRVDDIAGLNENFPRWEFPPFRVFYDQFIHFWVYAAWEIYQDIIFHVELSLLIISLRAHARKLSRHHIDHENYSTIRG